MEVVVIDGVAYNKASELARQFKYTSDYIGQLCRGRKVDAKLIGRTWYVNPLSLKNHQTARYSVKTSSNEKTIQSNVEVEISRQNVMPVVRKSTAKSLEFTQANPRFERHIGWGPARYEDDASELLPTMSKAPRSLPVNVAEALSLKVDHDKLVTTLEAEPLPEVSLSGTLTIASLDEMFEAKNEETIAVSDFPVEEKDESISEPVKIRRAKADDEPTLFKPKKALKREPEIPEAEAIYEVSIREADSDPVPKMNFTPRRVQKYAATTLVLENQPEGDGSAYLSPKLVYLTFALVSVLVLSAVSFLEIQVVATSALSSLTITW